MLILVLLYAIEVPLMYSYDDFLAANAL